VAVSKDLAPAFFAGVIHKEPPNRTNHAAEKMAARDPSTALLMKEPPDSQIVRSMASPAIPSFHVVSRVRPRKLLRMTERTHEIIDRMTLIIDSLS